MYAIRSYYDMLSRFELAADDFTRVIDGKTCTPRVVSRVEEDYPRMHVPLEAPILQLLRESSASLDRHLDIRAAGGGSDANIFNGHGIETVILGTGMQQVSYNFV